jgi:hypothetical protein
MSGREIPEEYRALHDRAVALVERPELHEALGELGRDPEALRRATDAPGKFLSSFGLKVPKGLGARIFALEKPGPDWTPWSIRLSNCRSYWVRNSETGKYERVEVCFGIEIFPNPVPGGPWG